MKYMLLIEKELRLNIVIVATKDIQFKENCMAGHLLARDSLRKSDLLFDLKLAREFANSKGVWFLDRGLW